jgi:hypothetical protein
VKRPPRSTAGAPVCASLGHGCQACDRIYPDEMARSPQGGVRSHVRNFCECEHLDASDVEVAMDAFSSFGRGSSPRPARVRAAGCLRSSLRGVFVAQPDPAHCHRQTLFLPSERG